MNEDVTPEVWQSLEVTGNPFQANDLKALPDNVPGSLRERTEGKHYQTVNLNNSMVPRLLGVQEGKIQVENLVEFLLSLMQVALRFISMVPLSAALDLPPLQTKTAL